METKFKDSGVEWIGKIPEGWKILKTSWVFMGGMGETILKNDLDPDKKGYPIYSATESDVIFGYIQNPNLTLDVGDLVIPARGNSIGNVKLIKFPCTSTQTTIYLKQVKKSILDLKYCYYYMKGNKNSLFSFVQTAIPQITVDQVLSNPLIIPPLPTQEAIAHFLDRETARLDALVSKKQRQIKLLQEKRQALITHAVTKGLNPSTPLKDSGVEWIGQIPEGWEVRKIRYIGKLQNGISKGGEFFGLGFPFLTYGDVYNNSVLPKNLNGLIQSTSNERKLLSIEEGDVFFTRTSETIEEIGISSTCLETIPNATFSGFLIRFRLNNKEAVFKGFLKYYFQSSFFRQYLSKEMNLVTRASLGQDLLKEAHLLFLPLPEQEAIAHFLDHETQKIDLLIGKIQKSIGLIKEYRSSLITHAVTGKIEVPSLQEMS